MRDTATLLGATGWHIAELRRFAETGTIRERRPSDPEQTLAVIGTRHKNKSTHFTCLVRQEHVDAAKRIREYGSILGNKRLGIHLTRACESAGVERFTLGVARHSAATWLVQAGVPLHEVSRYLGHRTPYTTQKFYVSHAAAPISLPRAALRVVK